MTRRGQADWSEPHLFQVVAGPSVMEVEEALAVLQRYLGRDRLSR